MVRQIYDPTPSKEISPDYTGAYSFTGHAPAAINVHLKLYKDPDPNLTPPASHPSDCDGVVQPDGIGNWRCTLPVEFNASYLLAAWNQFPNPPETLDTVNFNVGAQPPYGS